MIKLNLDEVDNNAVFVSLQLQSVVSRQADTIQTQAETISHLEEKVSHMTQA